MGQAVDEEFTARFDALYSRAYRVGYRLLGSAGDADDIAAETLARAYARWRRVRGHADAWVVRVATNAALDTGRRRTVATKHQAALVEQQPVDPHVERRLDLQAALRELPRRQCDVVVLRYLDDRSEAETAELLSLSPGTVKSHASRALARLRQSDSVREA